MSALLGVAAGAVLLPACGGGGGGGGASGGSGGSPDALIELHGPIAGGASARLSRTIEEANQDNGTTPPASLPPTVTTGNHWFRLTFPFPIQRSSILENSPLTSPFSYLNGNVTVRDRDGDHIPGMALVDGVDVFGLDHSSDADFPHDVQGGVDLNLGKNVFLYVADTDRNLSTIAAFGYDLGPNNTQLEITNIASHVNGTLDTVRVTVAAVNNVEFNGVWTFHLGNGNDTRQPFVVRVTSEVKDPTQPLNDKSADVASAFFLEFSEPMVPKSVGKSAALNGSPYNANLPLAPFVPPLPNVTLTATVNTTLGNLFVPFDCNPVNPNNLAMYRLEPLVDLPPNTSLDVIVRALTTNTNPGTSVGDAPMDLAGNRFDGQDADQNGTPDQVDRVETFAVGPGAALVNIPVSPEVIYWLPSAGDGIGAIDLNGWGITTNTPGALAGDRSRAVIITKNWLDASGCEINPGGLNPVNGIALWASPNEITPIDPCTGNPMLQFAHNRYWYPVGTGGFPYGPIANQTNGEDIWLFPDDPGNPGTPIPGVNEGSSGLETLCRDSTGNVILTGSDFGRVGNVSDMIVGNFLDRVFFDSVNVFTSPTFHRSFFNAPRVVPNNTIADPPTPNPPPLRYWAGLPTIGVVLDQADPTRSPLLLEGDEVFCGTRYGQGFISLKPNEVNPNGPDQTIFPHFASGPGLQSATQVFTFSSRQQIGNFLYVTDASSHSIHAINSNTMRVISSFTSPDPTGLAISPDMSRLYVSNFAHDNVSVFGADPFGPSFHQEMARIQVGRGPRAICVQPEHEDVLVCNYNDDTISIISVGSYLVRETIDALISGPWDIEATPRQIEPTVPDPFNTNNFGWACGVWFAYISNFKGNNVAIYESGPDGPTGIGINNIRGAIPTTDQKVSILEPRGLCASPLPNPTGMLAGGALVAHRDELGFGRVSHCQFTHQAIFGPLFLVPPPGTFLPPGFSDRNFEVTGTWGNTDANRLIGSEPVDVTFADLNVTAYRSRPSGITNLACTSVPPDVQRTGVINSKNPIRLATPSYSAITPDRAYVSFSDTDSIQVLSTTTIGSVLKTIPGPGVGGVKKLGSYWRQ